MSALDLQKQAYEDHCPICGEGIAGVDDHELVDEMTMRCHVEGGTFDPAVL